jgi:DNA repair protein RadC
MRIKDMNVSDLPRERAKLYGVDNLSDADLLSIVLRSGTKDISVKDLSNILLNNINGINNLSHITYHELIKIKGIGETKALEILSIVELAKRINSSDINKSIKLDNSDKVHDMFKRYFINLKKEKFIVIYLNNAKRIIEFKELFIGTKNMSLVDPSEIIKYAILNDSVFIVCIHNHPSGNLTPSKEDIELTKKLIDGAKLYNIKVLDHLITDGINYLSILD